MPSKPKIHKGQADTGGIACHQYHWRSDRPQYSWNWAKVTCQKCLTIKATQESEKING